MRRLDLLLARSPALFLRAGVRRIANAVLKIKKSIVVSAVARNPLSIVHWKSTFNAHYINIA